LHWHPKRDTELFSSILLVGFKAHTNFILHACLVRNHIARISVIIADQSWIKDDDVIMFVIDDLP